MLGGCYTFRGPAAVYDSRGVVKNDRFGPRYGPLFDRFEALAKRAAACDDTVPVSGGASEGGGTCVAGDAPPTDADMRNFMRAGYALTYADCSNYFEVMGRNQSRSRVLRDTIAPITSLLTGLITLRNFDNAGTEKDMLTLLSLSTGAAASGLDIFDQNFLFGANNIDAVRLLITRALAEQATDTFSKKEISFEQAVINIMDNQAICRPSHIMMLAREAIANGKIEPRPTQEAPKDHTPTPEGPATVGNEEVTQPPEPAETESLQSTSVTVPQ
jgi:hypothetical protein